MLGFCVNLLVLITLSKSFTVYALSVTGYCGDPGLPERSKRIPDQNFYNEDEKITYSCEDHISLKQFKQCLKGKWRGEHPICGKSFGDNDLKSAKIYNGSDGSLIEKYNTSVLTPFDKFANSFIAERYAQPLRAYGAKKYRFELFLQKKSIFHLVRISLSIFNNLIEERIKRSTFNITKVFVSPYRECRLIAQDSSKPWLVNSTRFNFWYACESRGSQFLDKELKYKSDLIRFETISSDVLDLDLATFILAQQYSTAGNIKEPICGTPEVPIGTELLIIHHNSKYSYKCAQGFKQIDGPSNSPYDLTCSIDMKWKGSFPTCVPEKTCKKFEITDKHAIEVFSYEKVYYMNESVWFAIEGTKVHFRCKIETQIFIGKEDRMCGKDGQWSDTLPNCLDTESGLLKETGFTSILVITLITVFVIFILTATLVYCGFRWKKMRSNDVNREGIRQSNIYDDYDFVGVEGKTYDENYETVDDEGRYQTRNATPAYTVMTAGPYKYNYTDKNVYDDCVGYELEQNSHPIPSDDSYIVMKHN